MYQRAEQWGSIDYDPEFDEFTAQICRDKVPITTERPISAGCLVTGRCNLKCGFCYGNDESLPKEEIPADTWAKIFRHLQSWGLMRVDLSGGEPTLRKDIGDIAASAYSAGLNVVLSTNGLVLHKAGPHSLPSTTRIHVSLDSGFPEVHEASRVLRTLHPSNNSFRKTSAFIRSALSSGYRVRALTCVGPHNADGLFQLGEHLAIMGVKEWNISRILSAGRALANYTVHWETNEENLRQQVMSMRHAFRWMRIRYSNRTEQDGYFLLVLPDGSLATQYTDSRDKVVLGKALDMSLRDLQTHADFDLTTHTNKWIAASIGCQHSSHLIAA